MAITLVVTESFWQNNATFFFLNRKNSIFQLYDELFEADTLNVQHFPIDSPARSLCKAR